MAGYAILLRLCFSLLTLVLSIDVRHKGLIFFATREKNTVFANSLQINKANNLVLTDNHCSLVLKFEASTLHWLLIIMGSTALVC